MFAVQLYVNRSYRTVRAYATWGSAASRARMLRQQGTPTKGRIVYPDGTKVAF